MVWHNLWAFLHFCIIKRLFVVSDALISNQEMKRDLCFLFCHNEVTTFVADGGVMLWISMSCGGEEGAKFEDNPIMVSTLVSECVVFVGRWSVITEWVVVEGSGSTWSRRTEQCQDRHTEEWAEPGRSWSSRVTDWYRKPMKVWSSLEMTVMLLVSMW